MTSEEFPHLDVDLAAVQQQPPVELQRLRIVEMPERPVRYIPSEGSDPDAVCVVRFDDLMAVIRELSGSQMHPMRRYGVRLEVAVVTGASEQFAAQIRAAWIEGWHEGSARPSVPSSVPDDGEDAYFEEETGEAAGNSSLGLSDIG